MTDIKKDIHVPFKQLALMAQNLCESHNKKKQQDIMRGMLRIIQNELLTNTVNERSIQQLASIIEDCSVDGLDVDVYGRDEICIRGCLSIKKLSERIIWSDGSKVVNVTALEA